MFEQIKRVFGFDQAKHAWGRTKVLWETPFVKATYIWVDAGKATEVLTKQEYSVKNWLFIKGSGDFMVGALKKKMMPGAYHVITYGTNHSIVNDVAGDPLEVLEVQFGSLVTQLNPEKTK